LPVTSHEDSEGGKECWASTLNLTFSTTRTVELSALRAGHIFVDMMSLVLYDLPFLRNQPLKSAGY